MDKWLYAYRKSHIPWPLLLSIENIQKNNKIGEIKYESAQIVFLEINTCLPRIQFVIYTENLLHQEALYIKLKWFLHK